MARAPNESDAEVLVGPKSPSPPAELQMAPGIGSTAPSSHRVGSIDAYRGCVMLLMMAEVLELGQVAKRSPTTLWLLLAHHQSHALWTGCSLHDLIQPSFSFLVGVALPYSLARRTREGQPNRHQTLHAFWRALILVLLGVFLRSLDARQTYWTFEDTLTQIGLGYGFLYLLALRRPRVQWAALGVIGVGYWLAFALYPLPGTGFDWSSAGVAPGDATLLGGFAGHWGKNTNAAWAFDTWFLNLFPRERLFTHNAGGYATLSFIPTLGTMILGLLAGGLIRSEQRPMSKVARLALAGAAGLGVGWLLDAAGVCPVVKRIWTPSWVLFSGGWCCLLLAGFYLVMDALGWRRWALPLIVVGTNSIAAYVIAWHSLGASFISNALTRHLGESRFAVAGGAYSPLLQGAAVLLIEWLVLGWMYRRAIFIRV